MDVQTREGIFGGGAYGGGVFDGGEMGFGALGASGTTYIWKKGDTGSSVAKAFTGNANKWTELAAANPTHKCATYGFCANPGNEITLPASWGASSASSAETPGGVTPAPGTAITPAASSFVPSDSGMSTGVMVAGLVGAGLLAAFFIMRKH
jgi:hypothetical protein